MLFSFSGAIVTVIRIAYISLRCANAVTLNWSLAYWCVFFGEHVNSLKQEYHCRSIWSGLSRASGVRETFSWGPLGRKFLNFFIMAHSSVFYISSAAVEPPIVAVPGVTYPPFSPPLDGSAYMMIPSFSLPIDCR